MDDDDVNDDFVNLTNLEWNLDEDGIVLPAVDVSPVSAAPRITRASSVEEVISFLGLEAPLDQAFRGEHDNRSVFCERTDMLNNLFCISLDRIPCIECSLIFCSSQRD